MSTLRITSGMNLDDALNIARQTGCSVEVHRRTGEFTVRVPGRTPMQLNRRRKDAQRALTSALRQWVKKWSGEL